MSEGWGQDDDGSGRSARRRLWQSIGLIITLGLVIGLASMTTTASIYKNSLRTRVNTIAETIDSQRVTELKDAGKVSDVRQDYEFIRQKLARIKAANADSRFVYLMARHPDGSVYFLADSEPESSQDHSAHGEAYPEASGELRAMFGDGRTVVEGPSRDSYGNWLSALAPVVDEQTYRLSAVVGIDIPATSYAWLLALAGSVPLLIAMLASAILYVQHQIRRRAMEHVRFRAEMLSIASHELRTPLTGLRWSQENLLSQKVTGPKQRRALEIMYDSTRRLQDSIEDILQLAGMESGKAQRLFRKEADIREILDDIVAVQQLAADRHRISLTYAANWPKHLPLECDVQRLKRVFSNLISNAVKYSHPDSHVTIGYARSVAGGHVISVVDKGIGIPAAEQGRVWDGFYRATNTAEHDITGTGMGLYLARSIVEQHGGRIWLESKEGVGTTVSVELPDSDAGHDVPPAQTRG